MENVLIHGNSLEELKKVPKASVDVVMTDPPYNIATGHVINIPGKTPFNQDFGEWDYGAITPKNWFPLVYDILKPDGLLIYFYANDEIGYYTHWMKEEWNMHFIQACSWLKTNSVFRMNKNKWINASEEFHILSKSKNYYFNDSLKQVFNYIVGSMTPNSERVGHPTQKPEYLIEWIMKYWTRENDLVVDPFMGSGTIPYVMKKYNRRYIGIERDEEWFSKAEQRLNNINDNKLW